MKIVAVISMLHSRYAQHPSVQNREPEQFLLYLPPDPEAAEEFMRGKDVGAATG